MNSRFPFANFVLQKIAPPLTIFYTVQLVLFWVIIVLAVFKFN